MRSDTNGSCLSSRNGVVCIGVLFAILWLPLIYLTVGSYGFTRVLMDPDTNTAVICILTGSAMSMLLVAGAIKRIASYMLPWMAIHFALIIVSSALAISVVIAAMARGTLYYYGEQYVLTMGIGMLILTGVKMFCWINVYRHYQGLIAHVQVEPYSSKEGKIFTCSQVPSNPYCHF